MGSKDKKQPADAPQVRIQDVITLTARLAQLLAEEVDLLGEMKVSKIRALQEEKLFLTAALESQRKLLDKHPQIIDTIPSRDRKDLEEVVELFNQVLAENHRKLLLAKEVNQKIVQAITDVVKESTSKQHYDEKGANSFSTYDTLSVTFNQTI